MSLAIDPTLSDLLPKSVEHLGKEIEAQVGKEGPAIGWPFVEKQVFSGLRSTLQGVDLLEQLAKAWVTLEALRAYKKLPAGETAIVPLGEHKLSFTASPTLKVKIGQTELPDLKFTYEVEADFQRATLSIRDGALVAVAPGECAFNVVLSCGKVPLHAPWTLGHVPLPAEREFTPGWRLP